MAKVWSGCSRCTLRALRRSRWKHPARPAARNSTTCAIARARARWPFVPKNRRLAPDFQTAPPAMNCSLRHERKLRALGFALIAGIDEAGRGPLAGPVVAAAVVLPER